MKYDDQDKWKTAKAKDLKLSEILLLFFFSFISPQKPKIQFSFCILERIFETCFDYILNSIWKQGLR